VSRERLEEHRRVWARKPVLADLYAVWFDALLERVPAGGRALEVGAGPGFLTAYAGRKRPDLRWVATDIVEAPWNTLVADAQRLPFADEAFDAVVGLDLIHHLARPLRFLQEASRVVRRGGRIAAVEPWVTPLSYPVYRWLHHEACTMGVDPSSPFGAAEKQAFDGDSAVPRELVRTLPASEWERMGLSQPQVRPMNGFGYLLSLGFRPPSLLPRPLGRLLIRADGVSAPLAPWLGMRALLAWERRGPPSAARAAG
jgi:SAM-dependent methyltransferase